MLQLEIVTPARRVVDETVETVTIPTQSGEIGILPGHAPLISNLKSGILAYSNAGASKRLVVSGGFVEVTEKGVSVLADTAEFAAEIKVDEARAERERLEKVLGAWGGSEEEFDAEKDKLECAEARLQLTANR